ncbi:MAG: metal-sensitive transcriptional regulator [Patescibacteria group bacterium]
MREKEQVDRITNRISRVEGQLRGIRRMVEDKKECLDIITQITAIREAVAMLGVELLKNEFICKKDKLEKIDDDYLKSLFKMK